MRFSHGQTIVRWGNLLFGSLLENNINLFSRISHRAHCHGSLVNNWTFYQLPQQNLRPAILGFGILA
jgi:hypothetical protein